MRIFQVKISYMGFEERFFFNNLPSMKDVEEAIWARAGAKEFTSIYGGFLKAANNFDWPQIWTGAAEIGRAVWFREKDKSNICDAYIRIECCNVMEVKDK